MTTNGVDRAFSALRRVRQEAESPSSDARLLEISEIRRRRDEVLSRYQPIFDIDKLDELSEGVFRDFLMYRNNRHWRALQRLGPAICKDMERLRSALRLLLDEDRPVRDRLDELVPRKGSAFVPRLGRAVLTPILLICFPEKYGVWNNVSEAAMKTLGFWPDSGRDTSFGQRYEEVNRVLNEIALELNVDLWTLDALWWGVSDLDSSPAEGDDEGLEKADDELQATFGLERHLHEFLRDNWRATELGDEWEIYQEAGDEDAGYEYPTGVGRIDLLARHKRESRWLVIELKRRQTSDQTVGQVLRYMGWIREELAGKDESVGGLVICHGTDEGMKYALSLVPDVSVREYEVEFRLKPADKGRSKT